MPLLRPVHAGNPLSITGIVLVTVSAVLFLVVFFLDILGLHTNPYLGMLFFLVFPSIFVFGLLLIPAGVWIERRRTRKGLPRSAMHWPRLDLNDAHIRRMVFGIALLTLINIVIVSVAAYRGVEYMDSVSFCGQLCHEVMQPEFAAHQDGPHARVACVQCHIGPGAPWFVRSKLSGTRQVFAVLLNTYGRPIPSPVQNLRPAREVCEQCHWPEKFHGDKGIVVSEFAEDEANTPTTTTLQLHVGGGSEKLGIATGIHWHMNVANEIEYVTTDDKRQVIPYIRLRDLKGNVREYFAEGITPDQIAKGERRRMDCMDCHNRPSHPFATSAERAVNGAMADGSIPKNLPFIRREAAAALKASYPDQQTASDTIAVRLREFYRTRVGKVYMERRQDVERAVTATDALYRRNVFPNMRVGWGTYPNNIGHMDFPGCFRCHDESHKTKEGQTIRQDCDLCHTVE